MSYCSAIGFKDTFMLRLWEEVVKAAQGAVFVSKVVRVFGSKSYVRQGVDFQRVFIVAGDIANGGTLVRLYNVRDDVARRNF